MSTSARPYRTHPEPDSDTTPAARGVVPAVGTLEGFSSLDFRRAMGRFATGVTVVSMLAQEGMAPRGGGATQRRAFGITVNAFMSVSLEPPLVAISIDKAAHAHATLEGAERFAISVLGEDQRHLSDHFAGRRVDHGLEPFVSFAGFPVVSGAVAHIVCRSHDAFEAGDHTIFIGQVEALRQADGRPLIFHAGKYGALAAPETD